MMYGWGYGNSYGYSIWNFVFMTIMMAAIIIGIVWAVHYFSHSGGHGLGPKEDALDVLKKRYANGEIDKKEFAEKKKDLSE
jgi:putative membrane protein